MFNDQEMYSYAQQIPTEGNRHLVRNVDDINAEARVVDIEHTEARIVADGQPVFSGTMVMADGEEIIDSVSMNIESAVQSFQDLIGDMQCRDVMQKVECVIGEKIGNVRVSARYSSTVDVAYAPSKSKSSDRHTSGTIDPSSATTEFEPQALGYSYPAKCELKPGTTIQEAALDHKQSYRDDNSVNVPKVEISYINVTDEYGASNRYTDAPAACYCNARISYKHLALAEDGTTSDKDDYEERPDEPENHGVYWVLDANRPQSGICFYVRYFLDCLFYTLGVDFDDSVLDTVADFNHLCFFTTKCKYRTVPLHVGAAEYYQPGDADVISGAVQAGDVKRIITPFFSATSRSSIYCTAEEADDYNMAHGLHPGDDGYKVAGDLYDDTFSANTITGCNVYADSDSDRCLFRDVNKWLSSRGCGAQMYIPEIEDKEVQDLVYTPWSWFYGNRVEGEPKQIAVGQDDVKSITISSTVTEMSVSANILQMIATSDNFPEEAVSTIIESLENAFGLKFYYDYERRRVTVYLIRDLFRNRTAPRPFMGKVTEIHNVSEKITGVRMCYSSESDSKEQRNNVRDGKKDYDTSYDYVDYTRTNVVTDKVYSQFYRNRSSGDMHCYIDRNTGNAYRVKIDSSYTTVNTMKPVLFEVGQWKGVEYGDCSDINKDFVQEFSNSFSPVDFNDVNFRREVAADESVSYKVDEASRELIGGFSNIALSGINSQSVQPLLVAYIDEQMEHEFVKCYLDNALSSSVADILVRSELKLTESYDPTSSDDGNSPLQHYDWGLSIAMMRGGGSDQTIEQYDYGYDHFGNARWRTKAGAYALASDTMDQWGNVYDYNGNQSGIGTGERFSLKIRAFKQLPWTDDIPCREDDNAHNMKVRSRGLFDTFMVDYAHFLLHRHRYKVRALMTVAHLVDIPNHWREWWNICGKSCLINKASCTINNETGIGIVELDVFSF